MRPGIDLDIRRSSMQLLAKRNIGCRVYELEDGRHCYYRNYGEVCDKPRDVVARCAVKPGTRVGRMDVEVKPVEDTKRETGVCQVFQFKGKPCYYRPVGSNCKRPRDLYNKCVQGYSSRFGGGERQISSGGNKDCDEADGSGATSSEEPTEQDFNDTEVEDQISEYYKECLVYKMNGRNCYWKPEGDPCIKPSMVVARCLVKPSDEFDYWPFNYDMA